MTIELIALGVGCFLQRITFRLIYPGRTGFDSYFHLYLINVIRDNGRRVPPHYPRMIEDIPVVYPYFFHWALSLLPKNLDRRVEKVLNPLIDTGAAVLTYVLTLKWSGDPGLALIAGLLYVFSPILFTEHAIGPRTNSFTPRLTGEVMVNAVIVLLLIAAGPNAYWALLPAAAICAAVLMSSQFSAQALVLAFPLITVISGDYRYLAVLGGGTAIALLVGRGRAVELFRGKLRHYRWYVGKLARGEIGVSRRNLIGGLVRAVRARSLKGIYRELFLYNPIAIVVVKFPVVVAMLIYVAFVGNDSVGNDVWIVIAIFVAVYLATSTKWLLFLGESERYLIHAAIPICCVGALSVPTTLSWMLIGYGVLFQFLDIFLAAHPMQRGLSRDNAVVIDLLNREQSTLNVATVPLHLGGWRILHETNHNWVSPFNSIQGRKDLFKRYDALDLERFDEIARFYRLDLLVFKKTVVEDLFGADAFASATHWERSSIADDIAVLRRTHRSEDAGADDT